LRGSSRFSPHRKRRARYGRYHPAFSDFRAAVRDAQDGLSTKYVEGRATLISVESSA
jgi:hypothetical protein